MLMYYPLNGDITVKFLNPWEEEQPMNSKPFTSQIHPWEPADHTVSTVGELHEILEQHKPQDRFFTYRDINDQTIIEIENRDNPNAYQVTRIHIQNTLYYT